jgi:hypothetical protein
MRKTEGTKLTDAVDASEVSYSNGSITLTATLLINKGTRPVSGAASRTRTNSCRGKKAKLSFAYIFMDAVKSCVTYT